MKYVNVTNYFYQSSHSNQATIQSYEKVKTKTFFSSHLSIVLCNSAMLKPLQMKKTLCCNFRFFIAFLIHFLKPRNKYIFLSHFLASNLVMSSK